MKIVLNDMTFPIYLGVYDWEQEKKINININIDIVIDSNKIIGNFDLKNTVDYEALSCLISNYISDKRYALIEELTYDLLILIMDNHEIIKKMEIAVKKNRPIDIISSAEVKLITMRKNNKIVIL